MNEIGQSSRSLSQTLAVQSQLHLPGTVGRLLKQIRDLEQIAPLFVKAGLVRSVDRPNPLNVRACGIATRGTTAKTIGGFLYASAAVRTDVRVQDNALSTAGEDSSCEIDDINYENQTKRLQLVGTRQAYELADRALADADPEVILMDCPLILDRSMVPPSESAGDAGYRAAYHAALDAINGFWHAHRSSLFPWNPDGAVVVGLANERYGAIVHSALQDLRSAEGRSQILPTENIDSTKLEPLETAGEAILGVGERRFIHGILGSYTRTAAFRMNVHTPRMEPAEVVKHGVLGVHFKPGHPTGPRLMQIVGDAPEWTQEAVDRICGITMALTAVGGPRAAPIPIQLAERELRSLDAFLRHYGQSVAAEMKQREVEDLWLADLDTPL